MASIERHVLVLGAGISGLSCAFRLAEEARARSLPLRITVLESSQRAGGTIHTEHRDGYLLETGLDSFLTKAPALDLCRELSLDSQLIETEPRNRRVYLARSGRLHPLPSGLSLGIPSRLPPLLRSPLVSARGKLRALFDLIDPTRLTSEGDPSIGEFLERRFGREMVDTVFDPLLGGICLGDVRELSLRSTFPQIVRLHREHQSLIRGARREAQRPPVAGAPTRHPGAPASPFRSLRGGMGQFIDGLVERLLPGTVHLGTEVVAAQRSEAGWTVHIKGGATWLADHLVVALPVGRAAQVVQACDSQLAEVLSEMPAVSSGSISLGYPRQAVDHPLDASGMLIARRDRHHLVSCSFLSSKWEGRAPQDAVLLRGFVGGTGNEAIVDREDSELVSLVHGELSALLGIRTKPSLAQVFRYHKATPQTRVGHEARMQRIGDRLRQLPCFSLIGNAYDGFGISDCIRLAESAAAKVAEQLASA